MIPEFAFANIVTNAMTGDTQYNESHFLSSIANFFNIGCYLRKVTNSQPIQDNVSQVLASAGAYVLNNAHTADDCINFETGTNLDLGTLSTYCYTIEAPDPGGDGVNTGSGQIHVYRATEQRHRRRNCQYVLTRYNQHHLRFIRLPGSNRCIWRFCPVPTGLESPSSNDYRLPNLFLRSAGSFIADNQYDLRTSTPYALANNGYNPPTTGRIG